MDEERTTWCLVYSQQKDNSSPAAVKTLIMFNLVLCSETELVHGGVRYCKEEDVIYCSPPLRQDKLNWESSESRPAVHNGRVVFSILLLAEFDKRLFCWQTSSLCSSYAAPATQGGAIRRFAGGLGRKLYLPHLPLLLWSLKTIYGKMELVSKRGQMCW